MAEGEGGEEMNVSQLEYHLEDYSKLLSKALVAEKGQKGLIKKLYGDQAEVVENCSVNNLREAVWERSFVAVLEGRKLAASFLPKIGARAFWLLTKNIIQKQETSRTTCEHYGETYVIAWKNSDSDELRREIEMLFEDVVRYAITTKPEISENFRAALEPLRCARNKQLDPMIEKILRPNLWRCLKSVNDIARLNACKLFFFFYPVVNNDALDNAELAVAQLNTIADLLVDEYVSIRAEACRKTLYIFSDFWSTFSKEYRKSTFGQIIDQLSRDGSSEVRLAVFEGMRHMIPCAEAVAAVEKALKRIILRGINDSAVKVRVAALQLLRALRTHRYIKWWNVVEIQQVLERLEVEKNDGAKKLIADLLVPRVFTPNALSDDILKNISYLGNMSRMAVIKFHECIVRYQLITTEAAAEHLTTMGMTIYKLARSHERHHQQSISALDESELTVSSLELSPPLVVDAQSGDDSTGARLWRQMCLLLECVTITWSLLREPLNTEKFVAKREKISRLLIKLFGYLLHCFKSASISKTILVFGSSLRGGSELSQITNFLQKELLSCSEMTTDAISGYIEALANWNVERVVEIVNKGLTKLRADYKNPSSQKRQRGSREQTDDLIPKALLFLETMLKSPVIQQNLMRNFHGYLIKFFMDLAAVNNVITLRVSADGLAFGADSLSIFSPQHVVRALELRHTLALILLNVTKSEEERENILAEVSSDVDWFVEVLPNLVRIEDDNQLSFFTVVCQTMLRLIGIHLDTFFYPKEFMSSVGNVLDMLCDNRAPHLFIVPVLKALKSLFLAAFGNDCQELLADTVSPMMDRCLVWMSSRCNDDDFSSKGCAEAFLSLLNALQSRNCVTDQLDLAKTIFALVVAALNVVNSDKLDVGDPREHDFEIEILVELLVHRILFKNSAFLRATLESFRLAVEADLLFEELDEGEVLYMFGAQVQFVHLCDVTAEKIACGGSSVVPKPCTMSPKERNDLQKDITACFGAIKEKMKKLPDNLTGNPLYQLIYAMCP